MNANRPQSTAFASAEALLFLDYLRSMIRLFRSSLALQLAHGLARLLPTSATLKYAAEWSYWKLQHWKEGRLSADHYAYFFTEYFGLSVNDYADKKVLDIGCGPRGSLEWAKGAKERIGLDPLAEAYRPLGTHRHQMRYVAAPAENIPFPDQHFDIIAAFNSLDHVDDLSAAIAEIKRVLSPSGYFLLIADVHAQPTLTEPVAFSWETLKHFSPELRCVKENHYEGKLLYKSIRAGRPFDHADPTPRYGVLTALLRKNT